MRNASLCLVGIGLGLALIGCGPGAVGLSSDDGTSSSGSTASDVTTGPDPTGATETTDPNSTSWMETTGPDPTDDPTDPTGDPQPEPCDVLVQDCPISQKCVPDIHDGGEGWCVPVLGDGEPLEPCTLDADNRLDDCGPTSFCVADTCRPFCGGELVAPECDYDTSCWQLAWLCMPACDPLLADCDRGEGCFWNSFYAWGCLPEPGDRGHGEPCVQQHDCQGSHLCVEAAAVPGCQATTCCAATCDAYEPGSCNALPGTLCRVLEPDPWCETFLGVCVVPDWAGGC